MRTLIIFSILSAGLAFSCKELVNGATPCNEITLGATFEAKVHDTWCLPDEKVMITIGPILEESRCNVTGIDCVWAGRTVLELIIDTKETPEYRDTLVAERNWQDTITIGGYSLELNKIIPEQRATLAVDTAKYRFQMILKD